jgi:hypothetical protein
MTFGRRLIALLIFGLFATHTFAGFQVPDTHLRQADHSQKALLLKSDVLSATPHLENSGKRIIVAESSGFQQWINLPALCKTRIAPPSFEKAVFAGFDLRKGFFLSPINLIFPFQYFW